MYEVYEDMARKPGAPKKIYPINVGDRKLVNRFLEAVNAGDIEFTKREIITLLRSRIETIGLTYSEIADASGYSLSTIKHIFGASGHETATTDALVEVDRVVKKMTLDKLERIRFELGSSDLSERRPFSIR